MALKVGQQAPEFTVTAADGRALSLAEFRGKKNVVLYFYPADFTAVCTKETCGFRDSYEDLASKDTEVIGVSIDDDAGAAVRCLRSLGRTDDAALVLRGLPRDDLRLAAEKAATAVPLEPRVAGDLVIKATWSDGSDLDLSVVTPQGTRVSWLGGRTDLVVADTLAKGDEKLALKSLKKGNYLLEIGRTAQSRPGTAPTRGTIEITALGVKRTLPFELVGDRAVVGRVAVTMQAQLQWLDGSRFVR